MDSLATVLVQELDKYAGVGANCIIVPAYDYERQHYVLTIFDYPKRRESADVVIVARIAGDKIIIDEDNTDKKLVDALLQQGIPRDKIILAYEGEPAPEFQVS